MSDWWNRAYLGSCESMAEIPDASVHCAVTSPPYFKHRDYGCEEQIGQELTMADYIARMVTVFREVRRVLRDDGTAWVNIGDSYAGSWGNQSRKDERGTQRPITTGMIQSVHDGRYANATNTGVIRDPGLKPKDLMMVPHRLAIALQDDGWWVRDAIVWAKQGGMPSSVTDRCTSSYEMIFMLAKSENYYCDMNAVKQPLATTSKGRYKQPKCIAGTQAGSTRANGGAKTNGPMRAIPVDAANLRNVWAFSVASFSGNHPAVYPVELPSLCIQIGCPDGGIVLDPFMGSGTTAQAAEALGRRWVGYEVNPAYHALIAERTRQTGLFSA